MTQALPKSASDNQRKAVPKVAGTAKSTKPESISGKSSEPTSDAKAMRRMQYKHLIDPKTQEQRKAEHLEAFEKLKSLSIDDLQVELIVCIRAGAMCIFCLYCLPDTL